MPRFIQTPTTRYVIMSVASVVLAGLWIGFDLPLGVLPAILAGLWIPVMATRDEQAPRVSARVAWVVGGVLALVGLALTAVFIFNN